MIQVNPFHHKNDSWEIGAVVKIGWMRCRVIRKVPTPQDGAPDAYIVRLVSNHTRPRFYEFVPHHGLESVAEEYALGK